MCQISFFARVTATHPALFEPCSRAVLFIWVQIGLLALIGHPACGSTANPIQLENAKPGTTDWQLANPALQHEIEGYASLTSVDRGGQISLFVNTAESRFSIEIFRMGWYGGAGARQVAAPVVLSGTQQTLPTAQVTNGYLVECTWTNPYVLTIKNDLSDPTDWCSGIYLAKLTASISGKQSYIVFTVRDDARASDYLFQSSVTTWQAYNPWGGYCLYPHTLTACWSQAGQKVSFNRPYERNSQYPGVEFSVGSGQLLTCLCPYTTNFCIPSEQMGLSPAAWEYNMVRFLEKEGYDITYCTDVDVHEQGSLLLSHKAFLSVGHDEYWSLAMRNNVEAARNQGVNLGFFSANTCYWQIRFEPSTAGAQADRTMVCYKDRHADPLGPDSPLTTVEWRYDPVDRPENKMIGIMYGAFPAHDDLVVTNAYHWVFSGTSLRDGDALPGLVGYEADHSSAGGPANLQILAHSPTPESTLDKYSEMSLYRAASGAFVFATGSIQWSWGLDDYNADPDSGPMLRPSYLSAAAQQITRNVLAQFVKITPSLTWTNPAAITYGTALGSKQLTANASVPGSFSFSPPPGTLLNAGSNQVLHVTFTPDDSTTYGSLTASAAITVKPAPLMVTASNATRSFGLPNPPFSGSLSGLQNGDSITAAYVCSATNSSPVGTYDILPTLNDPDGRLSNYAVSIIKGILTITPAPNDSIVAQFAGSSLLVSFQTVAGSHYVLESKISLSDPAWSVVQTNVGDGSVMSFTNQPVTNASRFYRIAIQ